MSDAMLSEGYSMAQDEITALRARNAELEAIVATIPDQREAAARGMQDAAYAAVRPMESNFDSCSGERHAAPIRQIDPAQFREPTT